MAKWFGQQTQEEKDEEAGKSVEAKFGEVDNTLKTVVETQTATTNTLKTLGDTIKAMNDRSAKEEADRIKAGKETQQRQQQQQTRTPEEEAEAMLNDPASYIRNTVSAATNLTLMNNAKLVKQEVLSGKDYYHGEFKSKVDGLIDGESNLALRGNPNFILNAYKVVLADHLEAIQKGELKQHASMHTFSDSSSSGGRNTDPNAKPTVEYRDNKSKYAAAQLGLKDEDIILAAKDQAIHGLEVVA